jgi:hypothetical protein
MLYHVFVNDVGGQMSDVLRITLLGVCATLAMDAWTVVARRAFGIQTLDYRLVGRWIEHVPRGRFVHDTIVDAEPTRHEVWIGWGAHFGIGIALAWVFVAMIGRGWLSNPQPEAAILYGSATVLAPLFIMQPAFGFGLAASRTRHPWSARARSFATHLAFGLGLYLAGLLLGLLDA